MSALSFTKESVYTVKPRQGLLGSTLSTSKSENAESETLEDTECAEGEIPLRVTPNFSVNRVQDAVVKHFEEALSKIGTTITLNPEAFYLMVADEEEQIDYDFPELDGSVSIVGVGIEDFILCDRVSEKPVLVVSVPESILNLPAREQNFLEELTVSCKVPDWIETKEKIAPFEFTLV